jgi:hypothetical protein
MSAPFQTLLLDLTNWDLVLDSNANIAVASAPYALAQDVASAIKTFLAEVWYDDTLGIPYFEEILGHTPPLSLFQQYMVQAALTVPGVVSATCIIESFTARTVTGEVTFVDINHQTTTVAIGS